MPDKARGLLCEPRVARSVLTRVIWIQVDEAALDQPVADLEYVAPPAGAPFRYPRAPGAIAVLAMAGALAYDRVATRENPIEVGVVVDNRLDRSAHVAE